MSGWWAVVVFDNEDESTEGGPREVDRLLGPYRSREKAKAVAEAQESRGGEAWTMNLEHADGEA